MRKLTPRRAGWVALSLSLVLAGCREATIRQVLADPQRYANRDVTVVGDVIESVSVLGRGAYQIEDETGRLWVVSEKGVPRRGTRVEVKGKIRDGFDLSALVQLPEEIRSVVVLVEERHKVKR